MSIFNAQTKHTREVLCVYAEISFYENGSNSKWLILHEYCSQRNMSVVLKPEYFRFQSELLSAKLPTGYTHPQESKAIFSVVFQCLYNLFSWGFRSFIQQHNITHKRPESSIKKIAPTLEYNRENGFRLLWVCVTRR